MQTTSMLLQKAQDGSSSVDDFKELLKIMIPMMTMQSFNLSGDQGDSDSGGMGFSTNSIIAPLMMSLMEKMLSADVNQQVGASGGVAGVSTVHINQFDAEMSAGGDGINADCGPTSLVMALHALGLEVAGATDNSSTGELIDLARQSMVADAGRDGVDQNGKRANAEHNTFTNFDDLTRGAKEASATAHRITPAAASIKTALMSGSKVIASGTFVGKQNLPWTGDRGTDNQGAPGNATMHIIAVTGYNSGQDKFVVDDPARRSTILVTAEQLEAFMKGNAGALAVSRRQAAR